MASARAARPAENFKTLEKVYNETFPPKVDSLRTADGQADRR